ncbi:MAG: YbaK/EbsC family protein [Oscillospiraceae bacterium]|nr:YbaK/EbsC family protein [Oscillospiraceae bacterium]
MSLESVKTYLQAFGAADRVLVFDSSSATVALAAAAIGTQPERIAKSLSFLGDGGCILVVAAGDARVDNRKFKDRFHRKATMLTAEQVPALTGHPVGGVCPFALPETAQVWLDESLRRFETVYPAAGTPNSAIELTLPELERFSGALGWVDVCKDPALTA